MSVRTLSTVAEKAAKPGVALDLRSLPEKSAWARISKTSSINHHPFSPPRETPATIWRLNKTKRMSMGTTTMVAAAINRS